MKLIDIMTSPWAIQRDKLKGIFDVYKAYLEGPRLDLPAMDAAFNSLIDADEQTYDVVNGTAIIPIKGVLSKNPSTYMRIFYDARSTVTIKEKIQKALEDPDAKTILLLIDSPGGTVDGTQELANFIYDSRGSKRIIAFTDGMMCSAATWIGTAADEIYISGDTVETGSIGVVMTHTDWSANDKKYGINITEIYAGKWKTTGSPNKPLSDEDKEYLQGQIDYLYSVFVRDVARNRGVDVETVLKDMADAKIFIGTQAIDAGLVDGVSTLDQLIGNDEAPNHEGVGFAANSHNNQIDSKNSDISKGVENGNSDEDQNLNEEDIMTITVEVLKAEHPEVFEAVKKLGEAEAKETVDVDAVKQESRTAETSRIKSVKDQLIPGHEALIETLMFDGETTGDQAAAAVVAAEKANRDKKLETFQTDGPSPVDSTEPVQPEPETSANDERPLEEVAKETWDKDAKLRAEFQDNFDAYLAYEKNSKAGNARILGNKEVK